MARRNIYNHSIELKKLTIKNVARDEFTKQLEEIPYRGYEVEDIADGRKIVIVKPGGKQAWGKMRKEDYFVFIYNPPEQTLWQIRNGDEITSPTYLKNWLYLRVFFERECVYSKFGNYFHQNIKKS